MKVILVSNTFDSFLQHRMNLALELSKTHNVTVLIPKKDYIHVKTSEYNTIQFKPFFIDRDSINPLSDLITLISLWRTYLKEKPEIVHHFTIKPVIYGSFAARLSRVPTIVNSITGLGYVFTGNSLRQNILKHIVIKLYKSAFRGRNIRVIFQNPDDRELFQRMGISNSEQSFLIFGSGVDTLKFSSQPKSVNETPKILVSARMLWDKGIGELIEASKILKSRNLKFEVILAGKTDPENPASIPEEILKDWTNNGFASWIGFQKNMSIILSECDIFCLPSYREGLPMASLEAMASGKPIVTTDVPGCRETISPIHSNGILVNPKNSLELANALNELIVNKEKRINMGKNSLIHVEKFTKPFITKEIINVYKA